VEGGELMQPKWTVVYNIVSPGSRWIGTGWEFFDDAASMERRKNELSAKGQTTTSRPYYPATDKSHLGAVHEMNGEGDDR
jgi:hypothetical protein